MSHVCNVPFVIKLRPSIVQCLEFFIVFVWEHIDGTVLLRFEDSTIRSNDEKIAGVVSLLLSFSLQTGCL